ncbi:MAG: N-acetyltransferase [Planctomycetota bacterium]
MTQGQPQSEAGIGQGEVVIRSAIVRDVGDMLEIINDYAKAQVMLPRSPLFLYENLRDFVVAEQGGRILGCGSLHVVWGDLGEIRSIAVRPETKGQGLGKALALALIDQADQLFLPRVYAFTYVPGFFEKLGFRRVEHRELPHKVYGDCLNCPKFNACDEVAVVKDLRPIAEAFPTRGPLSGGADWLFRGPVPKQADE